MKIKQYEALAKEITGLAGKYVGKKNVKLEDGSILDIGTISALRVIHTPQEYTSILYEKTDAWKMVSISKTTADGVFGLADVKTLQDVGREYNIPFPTLQTRLSLPGFNLMEGVDYMKLGKRQPTILAPSGIEKITKERA
ncbi:hypothetical protein [Clostridium sp.]|uniref:hypothetical protein n=1 Tax=Clostridium sp. TaxID=1506 RepID=UPI003A3CD242